ncbi:MAG: cytochrome c biogenesis protein ResB [Actinomycetota bacterium]
MASAPASETPPPLRRSVAMVWRSLRSMRTALILLLILALVSVAGSFVPQIPNSPLRVARDFQEHPLRSRIFDALGLFDVFGSWWFTLVYSLLLVSLGACLIPRTRAIVRNLRSRPQPARELDTFRHYAEVQVPHAPQRAAEQAQKLLRRRWFRVSRPQGQASVAADKGLAREFGSLLFHWSFFLVMIGIVIGKGTGFTGFAAITEGQCWVEAAANYDGNLRTGRYFGGNHTGAQICVDSFSDTYRTSGIPMDFVTRASLTSGDGVTTTTHDIRLNDPGSIDGLNLYQFAFGWAPEIEVRLGDRVIADGPIQFERNPAPEGVSELAVPWHGALRLPTTEPQRGVQFDLWPSFAAYLAFLETGEPTTMMTAPDHPVLNFSVYEGDLAAELAPRFSEIDARGLREESRGAVGQGQIVSLQTGRVLDGERLDRARADEELTMSFTGIRQYTVLQVSRDRGLWIMLAAAILILVGLIPALYTSRRKVWVRADPDGRGSVLKVGGFALQRTTQFEEEFARLVRDLERATGGGDPSGPDRSETDRVGAR